MRAASATSSEGEKLHMIIESHHSLDAVASPSIWLQGLKPAARPIINPLGLRLSRFACGDLEKILRGKMATNYVLFLLSSILLSQNL